MPATAGRVRMPHDNRMMTSSSLSTHSVWQNVIGYDPYAAAGGKPEADTATEALLEQSRGLMELAKLQSASQTVRPTCRKCGGTGHLSYECKNTVVLARGGSAAAAHELLPEPAEEIDEEALILAQVTAQLTREGKLPGVPAATAPSTTLDEAEHRDHRSKRAERSRKHRRRSPSSDHARRHRHRHRSASRSDSDDDYERERERVRERSRKREHDDERHRDGHRERERHSERERTREEEEEGHRRHRSRERDDERRHLERHTSRRRDEDEHERKEGEQSRHRNHDGRPAAAVHA